MRKVLVFDVSGDFIEDKIVQEDYQPLPNEYIQETNEQFSFYAPKLVNGQVIEGQSDVERLFVNKQKKIFEVFQLYELEKLGDIVSSILGTDGQPIVFEYATHNQTDYTKIGTKFALVPTLADSIIGSKSHGKFFIKREDYVVLVDNFSAHETNLYIKFKNLKTQIENATTLSEVDAVAW